MIQTGNLEFDAVIIEFETQILTILEQNAAKAAEIAVLKDKIKKLETNNGQT